MAHEIAHENEIELSVERAWTQAGYSSCVQISMRVKGWSKSGWSRKMKMLFDCGPAVHPDCYASDHVFVTHGHTDHIAGLIPFARAKSQSSSPNCIYHVPEACLEPIDLAKGAFEKMNGDHEIPMDIKTISPGSGEEVVIFEDKRKKKKVVVKAFETVHRVQSQGYAVWVVKQNEIKDGHGIDVSDDDSKQLHVATDEAGETSKCEFVYTGDTHFDALIKDENLFVFEARILCMECTYLHCEKEKEVVNADTYQHVHLSDIIKNYDKFQNEKLEKLVLVHISRRYKKDQVINFLRNGLGKDHLKPLLEIVTVNYTTNGKCYLVKPVDEEWEIKLNKTPGWGWG